MDEGILYKKRGVGMFVSKGAREQVRAKRRRQFYDRYVAQLLEEARRLDISQEELGEMIARGYTHEGD